MLVKIMLVALLAAILIFPNWIINLVNSFFRTIPLGYAGIRTRFGKFSGKQKSGLMILCPILNKVELIALEHHFQIPVKASVQAKDGDSVNVETAIEYSVDYEFLETYFYATQNGKDQLEKMIGNSVITLIGNIASTKTLEEFYQKRKALWLALNCHARMSVMPHVNPSLIGLKIKRVSAGKILDFYDRHEKAIRELVDKEAENEKDHSEIEIRYGINAKTVDLKDIIFSKETQDAINRKKRDEAMTKAADFKIKLIKELQEKCKLTPEEAKQAAEVSLSQTTKNEAHSVLGLKGLISVHMGKEGIQ